MPNTQALSNPMELHSRPKFLADLIAEYRSAENQLREAIEQEDTKLIAALDQQVSGLFDSIFNFSPANDQNAVELVGFLLDALLVFGAEATFAEAIKEKVLSIVAAQWDDPSGSDD